MKNICWTEIPKDAEVELHSSPDEMYPISKSPILQSWTYNGMCVYWGSQDAREAQDFLTRRTSKKASLDANMSADDALKVCTIKGNQVFLPAVQLKNYAALKQILTSIGGKWSTKLQCFTFSDDNPKSRIDTYLQTGKKASTKKEQQAFFTPDEVADRAIELAELQDGMTILEPSAGEGALVRAIRRAKGEKVNVECIEIHPPYAAKLKEAEADGWEINDFLKMTAYTKFDRVIMNPPFGKGLAKSFVDKSFEWLKPHGLLIAILPLGKGVELLEGAGFVPNGFAGGIDVEELPAKAFSESGTNINTEIVIGRKPDA